MSFCLAELALRDNPQRCWCKNARCRGIMCKTTLMPEQEHSCFTQVKLKSRANGSKYIKVRRGCTANCQAFNNQLTVQQCCSSMLCNAGDLNITHDNVTIFSVERLPMDNDTSNTYYSWSNIDLKGIEILNISTSAGSVPPTSGECECMHLSFSAMCFAMWMFMQAGY